MCFGRCRIHRTGGSAFGEFGEEDGKRRNLVVGEGEVCVEGCLVGGEGERFGEETDAKLFKRGVAEHTADIGGQDGGAVGRFLRVGCDGFDVDFESLREIDAEGGGFGVAQGDFFAVSAIQSVLPVLRFEIFCHFSADTDIGVGGGCIVGVVEGFIAVFQVFGFGSFGVVDDGFEIEFSVAAYESGIGDERVRFIAVGAGIDGDAVVIRAGEIVFCGIFRPNVGEGFLRIENGTEMPFFIDGKGDGFEIFFIIDAEGLEFIDECVDAVLRFLNIRKHIFEHFIGGKFLNIGGTDTHEITDEEIDGTDIFRHRLRTQQHTDGQCACDHKLFHKIPPYG